MIPCTRCNRPTPYRLPSPGEPTSPLDHRCECGAHLSLVVASVEAEAAWAAVDRVVKAYLPDPT